MAAHNVSTQLRKLKLVSYNMHDFNQGSPTINELINTVAPDIILCQEHWLTPANLDKFDNHYPNYITFGSSAMCNHIESEIIRGRPFGGLMTLIKKDFCNLMQTIHCEERFTVVKLANYLIINVYLPCVGTKDRLLLCEELFENLWYWRKRFMIVSALLPATLMLTLKTVMMMLAYTLILS